MLNPEIKSTEPNHLGRVGASLRGCLSREILFDTRIYAISIALLLAGCDQPSPTSFTSKDLANAALPNNISDRNPVHILLPDETLLCITQVGDRIAAYKTSTGYTLKGGEVTAFGGSVGVDNATAGVYHKITLLEALAYVDYNPNRICDVIASEAQKDRYSINPQVAEFYFNCLAGRALPSGDKVVYINAALKSELPEEPKDYTPVFLVEADKATLPQHQRISYENYQKEYGYRKKEYDAFHYPLYMRINRGDMLKVLQKGDEIAFLKTSQGYSQAGVRGSVLGFGVGVTESDGNLYTQVSASEVRGYFDHDCRKLVSLAVDRCRINKKSVSPDILAKALKE